MSKALDVLTGKSSLWPMGRSDSMPTPNSLGSTTNFGLPFISYFAFQDTPYWQQLLGLRSYFEWFVRNPVFFAVVMIKAREYANMQFVVKNRSTGAIEPENTRKTIPAKIYSLLNKPNILQERWEFLMQRKIFREVCGNTFTYGNAGMFMDMNVSNIVALWNVWPSYMEFKLGGKYFDATEISDIIAGWKFKYADFVKEFGPTEILHQNAPNLDPRVGLIFGTPTAASLTRPLSNIDMAYESMNVILRNRGARILVSSDKGDASGKVPLIASEKEQVQKDIAEYGTLEGQKQFWFSNMPLNIQAIEQDVRKMGLRDEVATDTMIVAAAFGVPEVLIKLYLQGATFENQEASVRRLYQGTLIPESKDDIIGLNRFLGLDQTDWCVEGSFDHVAALQQSKKDSAEADKLASEYLEKLFKAGAITHNQWLVAVDLPAYDGGDKRIWDFTPQQVAIILGTAPSNTSQSNPAAA